MLFTIRVVMSVRILWAQGTTPYCIGIKINTRDVVGSSWSGGVAIFELHRC